MANIKRIIIDWSETGITTYSIIRRETDNYRINDADGSFASHPADPYLSLAEDSVIKGRYEVNESRQIWNDGLYTIIIYHQIGGSPNPASDVIIGSGEIYIISDEEILIPEQILSLNNISVADIIAGITDGPNDMQDMLRLILSACACKLSGGGTATLRSRDSADTKDRIVMTVDANGNRPVVTLDGS